MGKGRHGSLGHRREVQLPGIMSAMTHGRPPVVTSVSTNAVADRSIDLAPSRLRCEIALVAPVGA
jgi:hypothetical protein